jgi:hypothetical protein
VGELRVEIARQIIPTPSPANDLVTEIAAAMDDERRSRAEDLVDIRFGSICRAQVLLAQIRQDIDCLHISPWSTRRPHSALSSLCLSMAEEIQATAANSDSQVPAPPEAFGMAGEKQLAIDADAQDLLIASLRSQIQDLFSQVTQLNGKLVTSYDRVSDLEDELHVTSTNLRSSAVKLTELELERTQHLSALNTGLLVEKSHVTAELTRLMEKATEEAAQRGQAETARADIEKELDDLSASLFSQANTMVAEARLARARSERKAEELEEALKAAEEVNGAMQQQMQTMKSEKEDVEKGAEQIQAAMGKGKWVERSATNGDPVRTLRLLGSHQPYQEFLLFIAHLRSIHPSSSQPPAISTLLPLPALARMVMEDSYVFSPSLLRAGR